jgi:hypothetical protein
MLQEQKVNETERRRVGKEIFAVTDKMTIQRARERLNFFSEIILFKPEPVLYGSCERWLLCIWVFL